MPKSTMRKKSNQTNRFAAIFTCFFALLLFPASGNVFGQTQADPLTSAVQTAFAAPPENKFDSATSYIYGIGSTSKVFTAAALLKLAEEGRLDLDAPLTSYIPEFYMDDPRYKDITPRMLINHTSGLPGSSLNNTLLYGDNDRFHHDTLLTQLRTQRLKAAPGEYSVYCNDGFSLAEILTERITKMDFTAYLAQTFWEPMGLTQMYTSQNAAEAEQIFPVYYKENVELPYESANVIGSGGIYASVRNLSLAGQMFTFGGLKQPLLSPDILNEMAAPQYTPGYGMAEHIPASMGYGYGWDSTASPLFAAQGIQALSKGGDTTNYHAMLTVLPEQNISCGVVSSGGSSSYNGMIAEEIIKIYLTEMAGLDFTETDAAQLAAGTDQAEAPPDWSAYEGWYQGSGLFHLSFPQPKTLVIRSLGTKRDTSQTYEYLGNNRFASPAGEYLSLDRLVANENGIQGKTILTLETEDNTPYLGMVTQEDYPGLGTQITNLPIAQKLDEPAAGDFAALSRRLAAAPAAWFILNEKYTSAKYLGNPAAYPVVYDELPGYLGEKNGLFFAAIKDQNHARFFQKLPGQFGRDLTDVEFFQSAKKDCLKAAWLYLSEQSMEPFSSRLTQISIPDNGYTEWYRLDEPLPGNQTVRISAPPNGHFYVYTLIDQEYTCIYSSILGNTDTPLYLPAGARIAFAGEPQAQFSLSFQP